MKRIALISLFILCATPLASAQEWAKATLEKSPRHREWVTVKHDNRAVETFVVYPESKSKAPVVLIIHEIFGMTDWVQDLADQVAAAGYLAVAPDLLSGMGPNGGRSSDFAEGKTMEAVSHLNPDQVTADLNAAADYALKLGLEWKAFCWRLLLGRRSNFSLCDQSCRSGRRVRLLRPATGQRGDGAHQGSRLRFLRRK